MCRSQAPDRNPTGPLNQVRSLNRNPTPGAAKRTFRISGDVPPEIWNRLGTKVLPKLRSGSDLKIGIEFSVTVDGQLARSFENDLMQILEDLGLTGRVQID